MNKIKVWKKRIMKYQDSYDSYLTLLLQGDYDDNDYDNDITYKEFLNSLGLVEFKLLNYYVKYKEEKGENQPILRLSTHCLYYLEGYPRYFRYYKTIIEYIEDIVIKKCYTKFLFVKNYTQPLEIECIIIKDKYDDNNNMKTKSEKLRIIWDGENLIKNLTNLTKWREVKL
ncbi:MAG: hypothetical protein ACO2OV_04955 [Thermoproteota archaeon]|jgi:hypothetical protein